MNDYTASSLSNTELNDETELLGFFLRFSHLNIPVKPQQHRNYVIWKANITALALYFDLNNEYSRKEPLLTWNVSHHFFERLLCSLLFVLDRARFRILTEHSICSEDTLMKPSLGSFLITSITKLVWLQS